jgi:hypothetical protein
MTRPKKALYFRIRHVAQDCLSYGSRGAWKSVADLPHETYGQRPLDDVGKDNIVSVKDASVSGTLGNRH